MKSSFRYIQFCLSFLIGSCLVASAQNKSAAVNDQTLDIANLTPDFYSNLTLPSLSVLLEAADKNAKVMGFKATKEEEEGALVKKKREWMNTIRGFGNYQYGQIAALVTQGSTVAPYSGQLQSIANVGVTVSVPLDLVYNRKNEINTQKARIKRTDTEIQQAIEAVKIDIMETYTLAIQQLNILKVRAESMVLAQSDIEVSTNDYLNGNLQLSELNYRKSIQATAVANYETTKAELNRAILRLELLTNIKILKK